MPGRFISLEGIDGSGKSTQARQLAATLRAAGQSVVLTREPGGSPGAEEIRRLVLEGDPDRWSAETEILLFTAARRDHLEKTIRPALARGDTVITDRFADSTRMYQGLRSGDLRRTVDRLHDLMIGVEPDLTILIDIDPEVGLSRAQARAGTEMRFEDMGLDVQRRMRAGFLALASGNPRFVVIDGAAPPEAVAAAVTAAALRGLTVMPSVFLGDFPEPDRIEGARHPRETPVLFGQSLAEGAFLDAFNQGRLHHAWLISGRRGIGKATLAWRLARFLLATPDDDGGMFGAPPPPVSLDIPADDPVARRLAALSEPRAFLLRRGLNLTEAALAQDILVKEVRKMKEFFGLSSADGGRRVAIVDSADELNTSSANALLKLLEEPPAGVTFLLISHQPHRLLPTIRSRCRTLRLPALLPGDLAAALTQAGAEVAPDQTGALAELAGGSVGEAFVLTHGDGLKTYAAISSLLDSLPRLDRGRALTLAESGAGKGSEARFDQIITLIDLALARLARTGAIGTPARGREGEAAMLTRLSPHPQAARAWADLAQTLSIRARRGKAVNLDPAALLMDMILRIDETAGSLAIR